MPYFLLETNLSKNKVSDRFLSELSKLVAELIKKPEQYVAVHIRPEQTLCFGGKTTPAAVCHLSSIGNLSEEENKEYSSQIMTLMHDRLKIEPSRVYIFFCDFAPGDVGYNLRTFAS